MLNFHYTHTTGDTTLTWLSSSTEYSMSFVRVSSSAALIPFPLPLLLALLAKPRLDEGTAEAAAAAVKASIARSSQERKRSRPPALSSRYCRRLGFVCETQGH